MGRAIEQRILEGLDRQIACNKEEKARYEKDFHALARKHPEIRHQDSLPGIGLIGAVRIVSRVVSPDRFVKAGNYLSYCGLIQLERTSGQVTYGSSITHSWINRFRRLLIRWEKKAENYLAMLHFATAHIVFKMAGILG